MSSATPSDRDRIISIVAALKRMPALSEVEAVLDGPNPRAQARFVRPMLGRRLGFVITTHAGNGLHFLLPDLLRAPLTQEYATLHVQSLAAHGAIDGRVALLKDGRLHYDLVAFGAERVSDALVSALVAQVEHDVRRLLGALVATGLSALLNVSPEVAQSMVASTGHCLGLDETEQSDRERIAV